MRLRADPKTIRVSIRRSDQGWMVTVESLISGDVISRTGKRPYGATMKALKRARESGFEGIDLYMEWSYDHPQKRRDDNTICERGNDGIKGAPVPGQGT